MEIKLIKALEKDKEFLFGLRKLTMAKHLEQAGLFLTDQEHMGRVTDCFEGSHLLMQTNERIGVIKYKESDSFIEIMQLQILPLYQGKGIGKYVLKYFSELAQNRSKLLTLKVLKENPAKTLYKKVGFKIIDEDEHEFHMQLKPQTK